jgi:DNA-binding response OmpR family regulator
MAAAGRRFDLLLSDLRLPDGNGWDLLRRLKEAGWRPKHAIAISGWGSETDLAESKSAGFQAHLIKPLAPEVLKTALEGVATAILAKENKKIASCRTAAKDKSGRAVAGNVKKAPSSLSERLRSPFHIAK